MPCMYVYTEISRYIYVYMPANVSIGVHLHTTIHMHIYLHVYAYVFANTTTKFDSGLPTLKVEKSLVRA